MPIRFKPRFTFKSSGFRALSWGHFIEYLSNRTIEHNESDWKDLVEALKDGSLVRWLTRQNQDKVLENVKSIKRSLFLKENINALYKALFVIQDQNILEFLEKAITKEKKTLSTDLEKGRDWIVELSENISLEMVWVKGGSLKMGSDEEDSFDDEMIHEVTLSDYWIGKYQLTQEQWLAVSRNKRNPSCFYDKGLRFPVENITWYQASNLCIELNKKLSEKLNNKYKFVLPTEAQWEYAARGGCKTENYKYSGSNDIDEIGWYIENSYRETHKVGEKNKPNELGIHDMSGNVWEWCKDKCELKLNNLKRNIITDTYKDGKIDPCCKVGSNRVIRGGSWHSNAMLCRLSCRNCYYPTHCSYFIGFRVALVPVQE